MPQRTALMQGDVVGFVALDLVLRFILARMMNVTFVVYVLGMQLHDRAADPTSF